MIFSCPKCHASGEVPRAGKYQCTNCKEIFIVEEKEAPPPLQQRSDETTNSARINCDPEEADQQKIYVKRTKIPLKNPLPSHLLNKIENPVTSKQGKAKYYGNAAYIILFIFFVIFPAIAFFTGITGVIINNINSLRQDKIEIMENYVKELKEIWQKETKTLQKERAFRKYERESDKLSEYRVAVGKLSYYPNAPALIYVSGFILLGSVVVLQLFKLLQKIEYNTRKEEQ